MKLEMLKAAVRFRPELFGPTVPSELLRENDDITVHPVPLRGTSEARVERVLPSLRSLDSLKPAFNQTLSFVPLESVFPEAVAASAASAAPAPAAPAGASVGGMDDDGDGVRAPIPASVDRLVDDLGAPSDVTIPNPGQLEAMGVDARAYMDAWGLCIKYGAGLEMDHPDMPRMRRLATCMGVAAIAIACEQFAATVIEDAKSDQRRRRKDAAREHAPLQGWHATPGAVEFFANEIQLIQDAWAPRVDLSAWYTVLRHCAVSLSSAYDNNVRVTLGDMDAARRPTLAQYKDAYILLLLHCLSTLRRTIRRTLARGEFAALRMVGEDKPPRAIDDSLMMDHKGDTVAYSNELVSRPVHELLFYTAFASTHLCIYARDEAEMRVGLMCVRAVLRAFGGGTVSACVERYVTQAVLQFDPTVRGLSKRDSSRSAGTRNLAMRDCRRVLLYLFNNTVLWRRAIMTRARLRSRAPHAGVDWDQVHAAATAVDLNMRGMDAPVQVPVDGESESASKRRRRDLETLTAEMLRLGVTAPTPPRRQRRPQRA